MTVQDFELRGEYIELNSLLKAAGLFSTGGQASVAILEGLVRVDGVIEKRKTCKVRRGQQVQSLDVTLKVI